MTKTRANTWRLIPAEPLPGCANMALDAALLQEAGKAGFPPTVRFMRWEPPALSLGRFQPVAQVDLEACRREGIDVTRRATGGEAVLHKDEFTYTVVLPVDMDKPAAVLDAYELICRAVIAAFERLGLAISLLRRDDESGTVTDGSCFARPGVSDLVHGTAKVCGSAQARKGGGLLQHGSVLLRDNAALLYRLFRLEVEERERAEAKFRRGCSNLAQLGLEPSRADLEEAFEAGFRSAFDIDFVEGRFSDDEVANARRTAGELLLLDSTAESPTAGGPVPCRGFMLELKSSDGSS